MKTHPAKKVLFVILLVFIFSTVTYAAVVTEVGVNKSAVINLKKPYERVSVANPAIADAVVITPTQILLIGKVIGSTSLIVWEKGMQPSFFDVRVVPDKLREAQQVLLEVKVAQIDKTKMKQLGIGFLAKGTSAEATAPGLIGNPTGNVGGAAGTTVTPGIGSFDIPTLTPQIAVAHFKSGLAAVLQALQTQGYAKILAEPNLVVRSGEKGNFLAGQKIPIQTVTGTPPTPSITYEQVGVRINFAPVVLDDGVIRLKIDPAEVSSVGQIQAFTGGLFAPIIDTREVRTDVDLREGESLVLAGLLDERMKKNIKKIPILGDIPILGVLFRSTEEELERNELAFFITPKLVKPIPAGVKTELPGMKPMTPEEESQYQWVPLPKKGEEQK